MICYLKVEQKTKKSLFLINLIHILLITIILSAIFNKIANFTVRTVHNFDYIIAKDNFIYRTI